MEFLLCGHGHSALQSPPEEETFTRFWGCLVTMFEEYVKQRKSAVTSGGIECQGKSNWRYRE